MKYTQLPDGRWKVTFQLGSRQRRLKYSNRKQLEEMVTKELYEFNQKGITPDAFKKKSKFDEICDAYYDEHVLEGDVQNKAAVASSIRLYKKLFPSINIREIDTDMIEKAMKKYVKSTHTRLVKSTDGTFERIQVENSPSSAKKKFGQLRAILNWAMKKGYIHTNPCKAAEKYEEDDTYPRFLDAAEIKALITDVPRRFFDYCFLVLHTGMRPSEALKLTWGDVDLESRVIYFVRRKKNATGLRQKNNKKATVSIDPTLYRWFVEKAKAGQDGLVLNYTITQLRDDSEAAIEKAGINKVIKPGTAKFTIYGLRHTFASHLLMAGEKIETVAKILRHSDINITFKHYGHLVEKYKQEAMQKINLLDDKIELQVVGC